MDFNLAAKRMTHIAVFLVFAIKGVWLWCKFHNTITRVYHQGEMYCDGHEIRVFDFLTRRATKHTAPSDTPESFGMNGHRGADYKLMQAFISAVAVRVFKYYTEYLKYLVNLSDTKGLTPIFLLIMAMLD